MPIDEHLKGTIYIPVNKGSDDNPNFEIIKHNFTEDDIIHNSCSTTSRCCDDQTFSIGGVRPAELAIKLRLEIPGVNAYTLYGAKIRLYSAYCSTPVPDDKWMLRGEFWVTSAKRTKTIYTIRASDSIIWLDSGSYVASKDNTTSEADNPIYQTCVSAARTLDANMNDGIFAYVNSQLEEYGVEPVLCDIRTDITNNAPADRGFILIPSDISGAAGSRSPRDYAAYLTQIATGCMQVLVDPDDPDKAKIFITPFGYKPQSGSEKFKSSWINPVKIPYEAIELDSCDIADYELYIHMTYTKTYDGTGWSCGGTIHKYGGNIVIDFSNNSFLDGRWHQRGIFDVIEGGENELVFSVLRNAGEQLGTVKKRPFSLKCHPVFESLEKMPKLGQRIEIEEKPGEWKESLITKMVWKFRGGWEFGCAGSDSRVLSQAAKRSLASHAEDNSKAYANIIAKDASASIAKVKDTADYAKATADNVNNAWNAYMPGVWNDISNLDARLAALESK